MIETVRKVGGALIMIAIIVAVLTSTFGVIAETASGGQPDHGALTTDGGTGTLAVEAGDRIARHESVQTSLGTAVELADGETVTIDTEVGVDTQSEHWSICTFTQPSAAADNVSSTIIKYQEAAIIHNGTSDEYRGYFFDESNRSEVDAVVAVNGTAAQKLLCLSRENATITLSRNTSASASVQLDSDTNVAPPPNTGYNGTVEETRIYPRTLTTTNKSTIVGEPTGAIAGAAPGLRLMYDSRSGETTFRAFFTGGTADASGASVVDSFAGEPIESGVDYRFGGTQNATLTVLDNSELRPTGAIVYVSYHINPFGALYNRLITIGGAALTLLALAAVVLAANRVGDAFGGGF